MDELAGLDNRLITRGFRGCWQELPPLERPTVAACLVSNQYLGLRALYGHVRTAPLETLIAEPRRLDTSSQRELRHAGFALVDADAQTTQSPFTLRDPTPGLLWLSTSGSTGRPKRVPHRFGTLMTHLSKQPPRRWLCAYSPGTYAWWQLVSLALTQPGQDLVLLEPDDRPVWPLIAEREGVTAVSGTPTFWWRAVLHYWDRLSHLPIEHIALGGEPVPQILLDRLHEALPRAHVWWTYASTEHGASIIVRDGRAGFPATWLQQRLPGQRALRIVDGELWIETCPGSQHFSATGDRAVIVGERVLLPGRVCADEIQVGGAKIAASVIQQVLLQHPAVAWAHLSPRRSSLVGQIPVAEVVLQTLVDTAELRQWCAARLPDYGVPRGFRILAHIPETLTGKSHV
ncbi:long-chain fatty acid--CoA ligase [Dyella sp. M7H15-1]|uniref:AMP-binding protein n=1 Tax=Dyella sp. M7H15-1 TaxID=2501295 RepID=UPI0010050DB5|nr:AMP-binding protein [Dyella sp. M7H15-1]QAU25130.1 long-chain fatty acid--CoA ligase [Dyella sp. M7H15-1]